VIRMTAGVVVLTLLVQGLTMAPLVEFLGLSGAKAMGPRHATRGGVSR
jgi:NhaP-type Na+/H+ or K+/H+ antiporter